MMKNTKINLGLLLTAGYILLSGCGQEQPKITHFAAINENFQTVFETKDSGKLKTISQLFYNRYEANSAAADFKYLLDVTDKEGTHRWRCSANGYCQRRTTGTEMQVTIYRIEGYKELYDLINLTARN